MIDARHLVRRFGTHIALSECSFEVDRGTIFGLVGPNGAGKTTTLRILAGLLAPSGGTAFVDGIDVGADPQAARERVGWMPDFFGVYERMTAAEYLSFYADCHRVPARRVPAVVADLLELVNLADRAATPVDVLSRGMKQRLCLARSLVHDPSVLLLDEPASGLDPRARVELRELLRELRDMDKTIVVSSHILPELAEMCTSFGFIHGGRMIASGPLEAITGPIERSSVRIEVGGDAATAERLVASLAEVHAVRCDGQVLDIELNGPHETTSAVIAAMVRSDVPIRAVAPRTSSLEEVFMQMTSTDVGEHGVRLQR
ncbi:MAG: ABC transporter ATP-binding protein [Candidatus Dormibacteraeota bacterium]|uniref:ABC transporter ATP-binding protein n=1 Tax=Candidatus Amunia macphersoniae TaxID=3127014 RepID=A0A934NG08_9BACT|nr:ABC transporter ATP-binding protein [Candidatus Dormibacteraeota bacterium]